MASNLYGSKYLPMQLLVTWMLLGCQSVDTHQSYSDAESQRDFLSSLPCPVPSSGPELSVVQEVTTRHRSQNFLPNYVGVHQCKSLTFVETTQHVNRVNEIVVELNRRSAITDDVEEMLLSLLADMEEVGDMVAGWWNDGRDAEEAAKYFNDSVEEKLPALEKKLSDSIQGDVSIHR